jgi:nucleoside-diphosphate-sugar epimerase
VRRVLLTGATGFVGRHCVAGLVRHGYEVHAVTSRGEPPEAEAGVLWHRADLLDGAAVDRLVGDVRPQDLLHLAWFAVPGQFWTSLENYRWARASLDLFLAFVRHGGERVVGAGSCAEYDWRYGHGREDLTPLAPGTPYGQCKAATGQLLGSLAARTDVSAAWGRIFFLYGPYEAPGRLVPSVAESLLRGERARCTHGEQLRDFLHVQDAADGFVELLRSRVGGAVDLASGRPTRILEVVRGLAERLGRPDAVDFGALPARAGEPLVLTAEAARARDELGWRPRFDLGGGLDQVAAWWREQDRAPEP